MMLEKCTYVYVAAKFEEVELVRAAYKLLRSRGYPITHDWTRESAEGLSGVELTTYLEECASKDEAGVAAADFVIIFPHPRGKGLFVELGIALGLEKRVIVVGPKKDKEECIFFHLCQRVETIEEAVAILDRASSKYMNENLVFNVNDKNEG